jgi:hypothetical protein
MFNLTLKGSKYPKPKEVDIKKDLKLLEVEL